MPTAVKMSFSEIMPFIRYIGIVAISKNDPPVFRASYDHRLFYPIKGNIGIALENCEYTLSENDVLYLPSGTPYKIFTNTASEVLVVNFDFTQQNNTSNQSLHFEHWTEFKTERMLETLEFIDNPLFMQPLYQRQMPELHTLLEQMTEEHIAGELLYREQNRCLFTVVLNLLYRRALAPHSNRNSGDGHRQILVYIREHYKEELSNKKIGEIFNYHPNYVNQLVQSQTGSSLHQYLLQIRIRKATQLLLTTDKSVAEIAEEVGFRNLSYFSQYYRKSMGFSPTAVRDSANYYL